MNPVALLGWIIGLVGLALVGVGALFVMNQTAYTIALTAVMLGLFVIIAGMAAVSTARKHHGLGVIY